MSLRIHCLQHASFEGPARIADWAQARGHRLSTTHLYAGETPPSASEPDAATSATSAVDWVVVMGGPMNVYEYRSHPWLRAEKRFLESAIAADKTVLGVCLGAQLIADVLGAKVYQNAEREIGWLPISLVPGESKERLFPGVPPNPTVFQWHGDTFDLPRGATLLASSEGCENQAFVWGGHGRVVGLQFHLETTESTVGAMLAHCGADIVTPGRFVQSSAVIAENRAHFEEDQHALRTLLDQLALR